MKVTNHTHKLNCWDFIKCSYGPGSKHPCSVVTDDTSDMVNCGKNAGRICWTVSNTPCFNKPMEHFVEKKKICFSCGFFHLVNREEGEEFQLFKLAQGVHKTQALHSKISQMEHLIEINNRLQSHFDLFKTIDEITLEARKITGAQRSIVFLVKGDPPALHGAFSLRGKTMEVSINIDDNSAVGYAAAHNRVVNVEKIGESTQDQKGMVFNTSFDKQCNCETHSLIAIPVHDYEKRVIGVITAANAKKGYFSADDEWFMRTYANQVALAIDKQKFLQQSFSALRLASIGETIAGLSHCIKNIAHALRGSSYIIKRAIDSKNVRDIGAAWEILDRHIENLANLSLDVLTYKPADHEEMHETKLNGMVRHTVELFQEEAKARAITLNMKLGKAVDPCSFDAQGLYRCLVNLITNAFDSCPLSEGVVTVSTKRTGKKEVLLSVSDNGRGMNEKTKAEMFELFETSKPGSGSGLGLPTVADIVRKHNGKIEIDSSPGKGTNFKLFIHELENRELY
jgi:signal transduction histidine kinase